MNYTLHVVSSSASANFATQPARLTLTLPAGVLLGDDMAVDPTWIVSP